MHSTRRKKTHKRHKRKKPKRYSIKKRNHCRKLKARGGNPPTGDGPPMEQLLSAQDVRLANMLKVVCKNSTNCIALGPYESYIKQFFNQFLIAPSGSYYDLSVPFYTSQLVMANGKNGFIIKVPFKRLDYVAYCVLKCSKKRESDSLMYEFFVGKYFINRYIKQLPCFVETYDLYEINDRAMYSDNISSPNPTVILQNIQRVNFQLEHIREHFKDSCIKNKKYCMLTQYFDRVTTLQDEYYDKYDNIKYEGNNIIYQVLYGLCLLGNKYTHYDLHLENVLLYAPYRDNQCILMRYHTGDKVVEFKSQYIAKIIDYGRNYFNNGETNTYDIVQNYICNVPECEQYGTKCGEDVGYSVLMGEKTPGEFYWINPLVPNMSMDLKFANRLKSFTKRTNIRYQELQGTSENMEKTLNVMNNIFDYKQLLDDLLPNYISVKQHKKYDSTWKVVAVMDIYDDGRDYTYNIIT